MSLKRILKEKVMILEDQEVWAVRQTIRDTCYERPFFYGGHGTREIDLASQSVWESEVSGKIAYTSISDLCKPYIPHFHTFSNHRDAVNYCNALDDGKYYQRAVYKYIISKDTEVLLGTRNDSDLVLVTPTLINPRWSPEYKLPTVSLSFISLTAAEIVYGYPFFNEKAKFHHFFLHEEDARKVENHYTRFEVQPLPVEIRHGWWEDSVEMYEIRTERLPDSIQIIKRR